MQINQEVLDVAFLETIFKENFSFVSGFYYPDTSEYKYRFTAEQIDAERLARAIHFKSKGI